MSLLSNIDVIAMFNRKLEDFLDDMSLTHPHVKEFAMLQKSTAILINVDVSQPRLLFSRYVDAPYGDAIRQRNETFLLAESFNESATHSQDVVSLLKSVWREMDVDNKDAVWRHLQTLVMLSAANCKDAKKM